MPHLSDPQKIPRTSLLLLHTISRNHDRSGWALQLSRSPRLLHQLEALLNLGIAIFYGAVGVCRPQQACQPFQAHASKILAEGLSSAQLFTHDTWEGVGRERVEMMFVLFYRLRTYSLCHISFSGAIETADFSTSPDPNPIKQRATKVYTTGGHKEPVGCTLKN